MEQSQYIRANKGFSFLCVPREFCAAVVLLAVNLLERRQKQGGKRA